MEFSGRKASPALLLILCMINKYFGLEMKMDYETFSPSENDTYSQLTCTCVGGGITPDSMSITRMRETGFTTRLLAVSEDKPSSSVFYDDIFGTGYLDSKESMIRLKMFAAPRNLPVDFYTCQAKFVNATGGVESAFVTVGPGIGNLPGKWPNRGRSKSSVSGDEAESTINTPGGTSSSLSIVELGYINNKLARLEDKTSSLDERLSEKLHRFGQRLSTVESDALVKVGSVETNLSLRVSRLEALLSTLMTGSVSERSYKKLEELEEQIADLKAHAEKLNSSQIAPVTPVIKEQNQPQTCERGMGDHVTKDYPKYVVVYNAIIQKDILCDTQTDGGGWVVFQRRAHGDVDFFRDWASYRDGFGNLTSDFWLGNEMVHKLTTAEMYELRVDMRYKGEEIFAAYPVFRLENEANHYRLKISSSHSGTANDAFQSYNNQPFSTFDRDNDGHDHSCAILNHGAWWYYNCYLANLNGAWAARDNTGLIWDWNKGRHPVTFTEMKIRPAKQWDI